ncbi:MAG: class I SAM-dependent DNA methyltransferase [Myxococcota bacterium]
MSNSPPGQVFTPPLLAAFLVSLLRLDPCQPLRLLDPALGAGALLMAVESWLKAEGVEPAQVQLEGYELDPVALARAREALNGSPYRVQLWEGDVLRALEQVRGSYDAVIANPPYVAWHRIPTEIRVSLEGASAVAYPLRGRPLQRDAQPDLALFFLALAVEALKPGGRLLFIMPPEWLEARRAASLRSWLLAHLEWMELLLLPPSLPLFLAEDGREIQTNVMVLVAQKWGCADAHGDMRVQPVSARLTTLSWHRLSGLRDLHTLTSWRMPEHRLVSQVQVNKMENGKNDSMECAHEHVIESRHAGDQSPWRFPEVKHTFVHGVRASPPFCALESVPGIEIYGGHQPPIQWLEWLSWPLKDLSAELWEVRAYLYPACAHARALTALQLDAPDEGWLILPMSWDEETFQRQAPHAYARVRARAEACTGGELPGRWWIFPNRRNIKHLVETAPTLLFARTSKDLRAAYDPWGRALKGTNTSLRLGSDALVGLEALWAMLNSGLYAAWSGGLPSYHGRGVRQEPQDIRLLRVPDPRHPGHQAGWEQLQRGAQEVLAKRLAPDLCLPLIERLLR